MSERELTDEYSSAARGSDERRRGGRVSALIHKVVVPGVFSLDGQNFGVENNVWLIGDDDEVLVIDAPHDATPIVKAIGGRRVTAILLTHGHNDHITAAVDLREATGAPIWFHPADRMLWDMTHPGTLPDRDLAGGLRFTVPGTELPALPTPGHSPGSTCFHSPDLATVFTGDTLFQGGPGATGRSFSDRPAILNSIRSQLLGLHGDTVVRTGHGDETTIAAEIHHVDRGTRRRRRTEPPRLREIALRPPRVVGEQAARLPPVRVQRVARTVAWRQEWPAPLPDAVTA